MGALAALLTYALAGRDKAPFVAEPGSEYQVMFSQGYKVWMKEKRQAMAPWTGVVAFAAWALGAAIASER